MAKRGYSKPFEQVTGVVTCPDCGCLVFPHYTVTEGTGYSKDGRTAPRRVKSLSPYSPPFPKEEQERVRK